MATDNNTIKTRIQWKHDTEANWNKTAATENSPGFIPLLGEIIVYSPDTTHEYSRLKVGNGITNVTRLPFIDAGTINGATLSNEVEMATIKAFFPQVGESNKLYIATNEKAIYIYINGDYQKVSNYTYTFTTSEVSTITDWDDGSAPAFRIQGGRFFITSGEEPKLSYYNSMVISNVKKEGEKWLILAQ